MIAFGLASKMYLAINIRKPQSISAMILGTVFDGSTGQTVQLDSLNQQKLDYVEYMYG